MLALMAAAHFGLGDRVQALALAEEARTLSGGLGARLWDFPAQLTRIRAAEVAKELGL